MQDGLIGTFEGWWVFLDWQTLHRGNYSAVLNMMYLQALRYGAAICELAGDAKSAGTYSTRAQALTTTELGALTTTQVAALETASSLEAIEKMLP